MKKKYLEPELDKLVIVTQLMGDHVVLSNPEYDAHIGQDDDDGDISRPQN